jgi:hypothetical protein
MFFSQYTRRLYSCNHEGSVNLDWYMVVLYIDRNYPKKMNRNKMPTHGQFGGLRDDAILADIEKDVVQSLIDDNTFLNEMKKRKAQIIADRDNIRTFELTATIKSGEYIPLLENGAPNTGSDLNSRKVGDQFPMDSVPEGEHNYVLRNYPKGGGSWDKALAWADKEGYKLTLPQEVFAVTAKNDLRKLLDRNWLYLVATTECSFWDCRRAVCVYVGGSDRSADLNRLGCFGNGHVWFLFRK